MTSHALDPDRILETIGKLRERILERFPEASLARVAADLHDIARDHARRSERIRRPNWLLRGLSVLLLLSALAALAALFAGLHLREDDQLSIAEALQTLEAGLSALFFLGASALFLLGLEMRNRRGRCLSALHELRAMAHIVDMHQLTKDPERLLHRGPDTTSSPARTLDAFALSRYLDYCSEMLSLMGKVAALYVQGYPDPQATAAVDDIESLTTGLSRKIWQKIMVLEQQRGPEPAAAAAEATA